MRKELWAYSNGGHQDYSKTATMTMLPFEVFYKTNPLGKILSFAAVTRKFSLTIDTNLDLAINMHLDYGTSITIKKCRVGLYYYDTANI